MISADFYPNYYTYNSGNIVTDTTYHIPVATENFPNMYYLGWIKPENVPQMLKPSKCEMQVTQDDEIYTWSFLCPDNTNFNCGYLAKTPNGYANNQEYSMLSKNSNNVWANGGATDRTFNWTFPNKLDVMKEGTPLSTLCILACVFNENDEYTDRWLWSGGGSVGDRSFAFSDFINFLYNGGNLTITSGTRTLTFSANDFDEDGTLYKNFDNSTDKCKLFICGYRMMYARDSNNYPTCCPSFFVDMQCTDDVERVGTGNWINYNQYKPIGSSMVTQGWYGGYNGTLRKSELQAMISPLYSSTTGQPFAYNGTVLAIRTDNNATYWYSCIYSPSEIAKHCALSIRVSSANEYGQPLYGYAENSVYAPYVTEDNEFTATLITGDLSDDEFKAKLRPWQYDVDEWSENDYTEEDLPPYDGGDTEDEESGQSIPIQRRLSMGAVSSFITCYGLTASQVQEFGKKLWSSWVDNGGLVMAMVENFKFLIDSGIASNTGSIDISSVLDFVVSLKVYPCDIRNLFAFSNSDSDGKVYIGRGTYGLEVSNTAIYKAVNQLGYLDAGTYNVPRPFGDFRDYTNINITVYVPYCGTIELNPADVIGRTLSGTYVVDVTTGECTFYLEVYAVTDSGEHRYVVGTCDGQLGVTIPVSATNSGQIAARRFSDVAQFATTVGGFFNRNMQIGNDIAMQMATLGASGMASKNPEMASAREQNIKMTGSQAYADNALGLLKDVTGQFGNSLTRAAIDAPNISGGSGIASFANPDCVWIQIRHGIYPKVNNYNHTVGKVSTKSAPLSSYSGFTVCHNVDVSSLPCTEEEKSAIKQLLETGVYL